MDRVRYNGKAAVDTQALCVQQSAPLNLIIAQQLALGNTINSPK
jgi:hypothetical protein